MSQIKIDGCITADAASYLIPLGAGPTIEARIPSVDPASFGPPDFTGGLYLPIRLRLKTASESLDGILRLRLSGDAPINHNPVLDSVLIESGGVLLPINDQAPYSAHAGDHLKLRARFTKESAETYEAPAIGGGTRTAIETLNVTWFATAGHFASGSTGPDVDTILALDRNPPAPGATVDLWVVGRDERGGLDFIHRTLKVN